MANRILNKDELAKANALLDRLRLELSSLSGGDPELLIAYRRKVAKMLTYDERDNPMARRKLKVQKRREQNGLCAICGRELPPTYAVLDRLGAPTRDYTPENTRLICEPCDRKVQASHGYA